MNSGLSVKSEFDKWDAVVAKGLATFIEVGVALREIKEKQLYKEEYGTFEKYIQQRHEMQRRSAYRLIEAATIREELENVSNWTHFGSDVTPSFPAIEAHFRELSVVPSEDVPRVWQQVQAAAAEQGKPITAKLIRDHAAEFRTPNNGNGFADMTSESDRRLERVSVFLRREIDNCPPVNLPELRFLIQRIVERISE